jgi:hypothetical protein
VSGHDDFAGEPILGLPEKLPVGEHILWQGSPLWTDFANRVFHVRAVAVYFALIALYRGGITWGETGDAVSAAWSGFSPIPWAFAALGLLYTLAWIQARATVYTITNKRVVLRMGVALTKTINLPFQVVEAASMRRGAAGTGDVALLLTEPNRIGYLHLWPHVRPWHVNRPEPTLRSIADVDAVADVLARAMRSNPSVDIRMSPSGSRPGSGQFATPGMAAS